MLSQAQSRVCWLRCWQFCRNLFGAALILAVAYILGRVVAELVSKLLEGMEFDTLPEKLGFANPKEGAKSPSQLIGFIVIAAVMLFALIEAARILGFALLA
ncbi:MAG: hypothetical protein MUE87_02075, partial [Methanothrix sp.]|nr:hypothetical protein [Methanothrix sp.]